MSYAMLGKGTVVVRDTVFNSDASNTILAGQAVILPAAQPGAGLTVTDALMVTRSAASANAANVYGVALEDIGPLEYGEVCIRGVCTVRVTTAGAAAQTIATSATAGDFAAAAAGAGASNRIGYMLEAGVSQVSPAAAPFRARAVIDCMSTISRALNRD